MAATAFDTVAVTTAPFLKKMKAAGFTTAIRYYRVKPPSNGALTVPELIVLFSEGFAVVPVFEVEIIKPNINQFSHERRGRGTPRPQLRHRRDPAAVQLGDLLRRRLQPRAARVRGNRRSLLQGREGDLRVDGTGGRRLHASASTAPAWPAKRSCKDTW